MTQTFLRILNSPILIFFVLVALACQTALFSSLPFSYLQPDFVLLVVVWCALKRKLTEGGCMTLLLSEIAESHSSCPQGFFLLSNMAIFLCVRLASRFVIISSPASYAVLTLFCFILRKLIRFFCLILLGINHQQLHLSLAYGLLEATTEGSMAFWAYYWLHRFDQLTFKNKFESEEF